MGSSWTAEELAILKANLNEPLSKLVSLLPRRSYSSIVSMRHHIKQNPDYLPSTNRKAWTPEEDKYLKDNYLTLSREELANNLGRTVESVHMRMYRLGLNSQKDAFDHLVHLTNIEKAYIAGIFDGEGYVGFWHYWNPDGSPKRVTPQAVISNGNKDLIIWLHNRLGMFSKWRRSYHVQIEKRYERPRQHYFIGITGQNRVRAFLKVIYPYLIVKKDVATYMIKYCEQHCQQRYTLADWQLVYKVAECNDIARSASTKSFKKLKQWLEVQGALPD